MLLELERRPQRSRTMMLLSPVIAILLTLATGAVLLALAGKDPVRGLSVYFVEPLQSSWTLQELVVKATPLVLIGVGLTIAFLSNTWNIGAEGQYTIGALTGGGLALALHGWDSPILFPAMLVAGALGGALWAAIPAVLKVRFNANEILTSLMLVYVAQLVLDYLVRGPWRSPDSMNFPETRLFHAAAQTPLIAGDGRLHLGAVIALAVAVAASVMLGRSIKGFEIRVLGEAPRAGAFAGFSRSRLVFFAFLVSGALAGLAGLIEVAGPVGQLLPTISPGYGFTAIIVAFLGRLNPIGAVLAALLLALSYIGGEAAQVELRLPRNVTQVFQGILLFYVLACDTLILYRLRFMRGGAGAEARHGRA
jgi:general nucleoside transport system permease protein